MQYPWTFEECVEKLQARGECAIWLGETRRPGQVVLAVLVRSEAVGNGEKSRVLDRISTCSLLHSYHRNGHT
jgi:hypothetical protein